MSTPLQNSARPGELRVEALTKRIGDFILTAEFRVGMGERAALLGRSGIGKTSLLRLLAGLDPADAGRVWVGDREITRLPPEKREVGMVFQEQALFPAMNVMENVTFGLRMRGVSRGEAEARALRWIESTGLSGRVLAPISALSGGERQRVAFIRAVIWKPSFLLLDEPFSALDGELRNTLRKELIGLHELWPVPMLVVTHDQADLDMIATCRLRFSDSGETSTRRVERE